MVIHVLIGPSMTINILMTGPSMDVSFSLQFLLLDHQMDGHYPAVTFVLFVIHYLQHTTPPVLPVLHEMVPMSKTTEDDKEIEFDMSLLVTAGQKWQTTNEQSLGELLYGLLKWVWSVLSLFHLLVLGTMFWTSIYSNMLSLSDSLNLC